MAARSKANRGRYGEFSLGKNPAKKPLQRKEGGGDEATTTAVRALEPVALVADDAVFGAAALDAPALLDGLGAKSLREMHAAALGVLKTVDGAPAAAPAAAE